VSDGSVSSPAVPSKTVVGGRMTLKYPCLEYPWLAHGTVVFKDRGFESPDSAWRGRVAEFLRQHMRPAPSKIVIPVQVHGSLVIQIRAGGHACETPTCDGLVTVERGVMIGVNTADCVPLLAVDGASRVVGAAHCGWRGIAAGVVESFLGQIGAAAKAESPEGRGGPGGARFLIGSSVGPCCYEVGDDFLAAFSAREVGECAETRGGKTVFDLKRLVRLRLIDEGIDRAAVFTDNTCTSCASDSLCSYRAAGDICGRMYTFAMILGEE